MTVRFIEMDPEHVPAVAALEAASNETPWSEALLAAEFDVAPGSRHWLVGIEDDNVVAFGGLMFVGDDAHLMNLAVSPDSRRNGIGRALIDQLVIDGIAFGATNLTLEVRVSNTAAIALYEECGLHQVGIRPGYYEDGEDAVIMWWYDLPAAQIGEAV